MTERLAPDPSFAEAVAPYRRELLAHCYRMTGSFADAEDALQESLVRAWRGLAGFERRASMRTWLYRVATNTCLTMIGERRARTMPHLMYPAGSRSGDSTGDHEPTWLEPFPDALLEDDPDTRPDALYSRRHAVRLAFIAALQRLPARQRATLILRDVVALSAEETAAALEMTVAASNSLLQRARELVDEESGRPAPVLERAAEANLLSRYVDAWEGGDAKALIALLREDAIASMPPTPLWVQGPQAVIDCMVELVWSGGEIRLTPYAANAAPAFAVYQRRDGVLTLAALSVVDVRSEGVASIHSFLTSDPVAFGARYTLAPHLGG